MSTNDWRSKLLGLTDNSRFWVLAIGITASIILAGILQLYIPDGSSQSIRIEKAYSFISLGLLYVALLASPLLKVFPRLPFKKTYLYIRRPIGVLAFYYAFLHAYITFFNQLGGFDGVAYYAPNYVASLLLGVIGLAILCILAVTSVDWAIRIMHFKNWKLLHRLVYIAGVVILIHIVILGPDFNTFSALGIATYAAVIILLGLEIARVVLAIKDKRSS